MLKHGEIKILVIEDDKFLRELLVGKLKKEGYATTEAVDGEGGLDAAKKDPPHLIMLDLVLPGADGFEILQSLKNNPDSSKIPVIVLSNLGSREDIDRALSLGAKEFLVKAHHTPQEIVDTIKKVLDASYFQK
ncbi:hypothetical protein A3B19_00510 [Candidatus Giovannonibacteria bacterium RIFCSPLOWO2_01_FULL_46_32]|uniref:Response regulatory domain-containing protein n=1 Tax=Candidatus Giovannonibacteria bacterium RIFCSPLOWO2_01_FULL_46_32 TaxID=1798353 RepID=A0A1F5XF63_9BACT|nr:MAG: hypothetical protein A3B19_00510 [Candidatus Giovannonibacteria bacterium RIFCSPLOWO2_01_FULL_46_32]